MLSPLRARKSNNYRYRDSWKSDNFRERAIKKSKELIPKRMQKELRVITLQGAIEKSPILLSQYWKSEWLDDTIIISYFGGSNNIFVITRVLGLLSVPVKWVMIIKGAYWISSNSSFIQYCDSNIGLFSIAPPLVIALPTLR